MPSVFISYARQSSTEPARALRRALGRRAFLDEREIEDGEEFPARILNALLDSRVVVLLLDEAYFARRFCLWELRATLMPFSRAPAALGGTLDHVVIALPPGDPRAFLGRLPRALQEQSWPPAERTRDLASLVEHKLSTAKLTLRDGCARAGLTDARLHADLRELVAAPPPRSLGGLPLFPLGLPPSKGERFVGRADELWQIDDAFAPIEGGPADAARVVALEGSGGSGKTQLALEYVHRLGARRFSGGIFWVNAECPIEPQHHGILRTLQPETPDLAAFSTSVPPRNATAELRAALHAASARAPMLFVVDNLPEPCFGEAPEPLEKWCPAIGKVAVLTTSRMRSGGIGARALPVETLTQPSAIQLLTRDLWPAPAPRECAEIVEWVGRLPLALTVLNAYLHPDPTLKLPGILAKARAGEGQTGELDSEAASARARIRDPLRGATDAYSCSFQHLSPEGRRAARLLALLAPHSVPVELVRELKIDACTGDELLDRSFVNRSACLVAMSAGGAVPMFGFMHRVLADVVRGQGPLDEPTVEVSQALCSVLVRAREARNRWDLIAVSAPHAQHVLRRADGLPDELRARFLNVLCTCLGGLGRREEGLPASAEAVAIYRRLERKSPGAFATELARSLNNYSRRLAALGRDAEGLEASLESVEIRRGLAKADPARFPPALASSLVQLSYSLGALGQRERALEASEEAVNLYCRTKPGSEGEERDLADALDAYSIRLSGLGQRELALEMNQEAVKVYRHLVQGRPGAFEPELAYALTNLSNRLGALGDPEKAREAGEQAVDLYRKLVKARPGAFDPDLAMALGSLSNWLRELGKLEEALAVTRESLEEYRRLARAQPAAFEPPYALALNKLSVLLGDLGEAEESLLAIQEAVAIRRRLADARPGAFWPGLADSLLNLSIRQSELGQWSTALCTSREAVAIYQRLAGTWLDRFEPDLANALGNLSGCLSANGQKVEGLTAILDAVAIYRRLAAARPRSFEPDLAWSLNALTVRFQELDRTVEARDASAQAVALYRKLAASRPAAFDSLLQGALENRRLLGAGRAAPGGARKRKRRARQPAARPPPRGGSTC